MLRDIGFLDKVSKRLFAALIILITVTGCVINNVGEGTHTPLAAPTVVILPSHTPAPTTTSRPTPAPIQLPTATPTLFPTPELNPMTIEAMRAGNYPGSDIFIVRELDPGENYRRYYVYYLSEGLKIYALLTIPNGDPPAGGWPGIVFNHGYIPPEEYRTTERYIAYVDWLARAGYVVFRIDYRGHDQSEGEAKGAYGDPGYENDVLNAIASLKRFSQVNPEKIGMWGHSMGGYLTLRTMVISKDIKAGVIWAGVVAPYVDLLYRWSRTGTFPPSPSSRGVGWRNTWIQLYGTPEQNPAFWNSVSANSYLADLSGPLQLHHGTADEDVPTEFSTNLAVAVRNAGGSAELYLYDGDNHNIANYFTMAMNRTIAFFDEHLK